MEWLHSEQMAELSGPGWGVHGHFLLLPSSGFRARITEHIHLCKSYLVSELSRNYLGRVNCPMSACLSLSCFCCFLSSPHSRSPWLLLTVAVLDHSISTLNSLSKWLYIHSAECACHFGVPPIPASALVWVCLGPCLPGPSPPDSREVRSLLPGEQALCPPRSYLFRGWPCPSVCHSL